MLTTSELTGREFIAAVLRRELTDIDARTETNNARLVQLREELRLTEHSGKWLTDRRFALVRAIAELGA